MDSGAGESVFPTAMLKTEPVHHTDKVGRTYRAAGGQALVNRGEKRIKFSTNGIMGSMNFQAIDEVSKPLASAARITEKGNQMVSNDENGESYIKNHKSDKRIPLVKENGVYVMEVEYLTQAFAGPAR